MGAGKTSARGRIRASGDGADRGIRAGESRGVRSGTKMGQQQRGRGEGKSRLEASSTATTTSRAALLAEAESLLREGRAEDALPLALRALDEVASTEPNTTPTTTTTTTTALPAHNLLGEIYLELGNPTSARTHFLHAVTLDPSGQIPTPQGGGPEKFLWLAQLSDEGGQDSISWFERGAAVLRREIAATQQQQSDDKEGPEKLKRQLAGALCGMIEVYMTDLSWSSSAEAQCERLISEALLMTPNYAPPLQTLASIRISQNRIVEARKALRESVALWRTASADGDEDDDDDAVPDFPTRISLCRLLMEVGMEEEALGVVERLVREDDGSVEAWYLGGWCLYLLGGKQAEAGKSGNHDGVNGVDGMEDGDGVVQDGLGKNEKEENGDGNLYMQSMVSSREWLKQSLKLFEMVGYEDERLRDHARELVGEIDGIFGEQGAEEEEVVVEEWDGFGDDEDEDGEQEDEDEEMDEG